MDSFLRPLNLGEIFDRTAALYRTRFPLFAGISAIFAAVMLAVQLLHLGLNTLLGYPHIQPRLQWASALSGGINLLAISLLAGLSIAASSRAVAWVYLGETASVHSAVTSVFSRLRRYLWLMTVTTFRAWGPLLGLYVLLIAIVFAAGSRGGAFAPHAAPRTPQVTRQAPTVGSAELAAPAVPVLATAGPAAAAGAIAGVLIVILLFFPAIAYGMVMWLRYSLAMPACVVEGLPAGKAIRRSIDLSEGSRGRIFVLWLLVAFVRIALGILFGFHAFVQIFKHPGQPLPIGWLVYQQFAVFAMDTLIGPIYSIGLTLFYYDQRIRKEGYDIEWMMHAAGLVPPQSGALPAASPTY